MRQSRAKLEDSKFEAERRRKYCGAARIALEAIHLPEEPDVRRVEELEEIFRREGCRPEHIANHVLLLIDQSSLEDAIRTSGLSSAALLQSAHNEYPELRFPRGRQLECLHGKHRIQAGREYLPARDKWWVADLYLSGEFVHLVSRRVVFMPCASDISHDVLQFLTEEYSNEAARKDGEIYRKIRQYHFERNLSFEMRWWARLKGNRAQNLKSILRHDEIRAAFDALLDMPGQWDGMQLTTIHKMMALKFDEVAPIGRSYFFHAHSLAAGTPQLSRRYPKFLARLAGW